MADHSDTTAASVPGSIHEAAENGNVERVRELLSLHGNALATALSPSGRDPLTHLCFSPNLIKADLRDAFLEAARALLDAGAPAQTGFQETIDHGVRQVLQSTVYGAGCVGEHTALLALLIERGADPNDEELPYHLPESSDTIAAARVVIGCGRLSTNSLSTLLLRYADHHNADGVALCLANGALPNGLTVWGYSALQQAIRRDNSMTIVRALLDAGGDITSPVRALGISTTALVLCRGRVDIVREAEARGRVWSAALAGEAQPEYFAALLAAVQGQPPASEADRASARLALARNVYPVLTAAGAAIGDVLCAWAGNNNAAGLAQLGDLGVSLEKPSIAGDPYFGSPAGSRPLHVAAWRGAHDAVALLLARGCAVDGTDPDGRSPLMLAVRAGLPASYWSWRKQTDSVAALLGRGGKVTRAIAAAADSGWPEAATLCGTAAAGPASASGSVHVREVQASDRGEWERLWRGYLAFYKTELPAATFDLTFARLLDPAQPSMFGLIAEADGAAVGLVHCVLHASFWTEAPYCYLQDLFTDPAARGRGVGRALIQAVYDRVEGKAARVYWHTHETNTTAMALYNEVATKSGFIEFEHVFNRTPFT